MRKIFPFDAAIFDLDGTLLDSMYVWHHIDDVYFARRGMKTPPDYGRALAGLSYRESAEYTKARFGFPEPWEEIVQEWTTLAREEYAVEDNEGTVEIRCRKSSDDNGENDCRNSRPEG